MAAVLSAGPGALASHRWALWLYDLGRLPSGLIDVTTPTTRSGRTDIRLHRATVTHDHSQGIPVTPPVRAIVDCIPTLTDPQLRRAVNLGQVKGLFGAEAMLGTRLEHLVAADQYGATRSLLEDLVLDLTRANRWHAPLINHDVHGVEVDFWWPHLSLIVEADGYDFHRTKIQFEDDHERRLFLEARGQRVVAVTYAQVTMHAERTADRLAAVIRHRMAASA